MTLAPICISTYIRINHLQQTIEALKRNTLAAESEVYIFSDGPKPGHEEKVQTVRHYLREVRGFKKIEIIESPKNAYPNSLRQGMRTLLDTHGKMISFEEDIITAPAFLEFMNQALSTYEHNPNIFSVTGYCPPISIPKDYPYDVFLLPRFCAWGFGIWRDRFDLIKFPLPKDEILEFIKSWKNISSFGLGGLDMLAKIKKDALGKIDGVDVKAFYYQHKHGMDTLYPIGSLVRNIGLDGTGLHSVRSNFKDVELVSPDRKWSLVPNIQRDKSIIKSNFLFRLRGGKKFRPSRGNLWLFPYFLYRLIRKIPLFS